MSIEQGGESAASAIAAVASRRRHQPASHTVSLLPPAIDAINRSCHEKQNTSLRFHMIYGHYYAQKKRRVEEGSGQDRTGKEQAIPSAILSRVKPSSDDDNSGVAFEGNIRIFSDRCTRVEKCTGYAIAVDPKDDNNATVVIDIANEELAACWCPVSVLDPRIVDELRRLQTSKRTRYSPTFREVVFESKAAVRGDVEGYLLTDAVKGLRGRVVDSALLAALKSGCLRRGSHSSCAFYTLDRVFYNDFGVVQKEARTIIPSKHGLQLFPASLGSGAAHSIVRCGEAAVESMRTYHRTMRSTIETIDRAKCLGERSKHERCVQVALGGDRSANDMKLGRFLACEGLSKEHDVDVRCACGFHVDGIKPSTGLLRRNCRK